MKIIFILLIIALIYSLAKKKNDESAPEKSVSLKKADPCDVVQYSIKVEDFDKHKKEVIDNLVVISDLYECSKAELIDQDYVDEDIPKYEAKKRDVEFIDETEDSMKVLIDGIHVGYVPAKNLRRVRNMLKKNDLEVTWSLTGGPSKCIDKEYDYETEQLVYVVDKIDTEMGIKVTFRYLKPKS